MYEVIRWLPDGSAKYWSNGSFSHNPFSASKHTLEDANYIRAELLAQGYSRDDIEVMPG